MGYLGGRSRNQEQADDRDIRAHAQQAHDVKNEIGRVREIQNHGQTDRGRPRRHSPGGCAAAARDREQSAISPSTPAKNSNPSSATGTPPNAPNRLVYASVQFNVELTSQKLA